MFRESTTALHAAAPAGFAQLPLAARVRAASSATALSALIPGSAYAHAVARCTLFLAVPAAMVLTAVATPAIHHLVAWALLWELTGLGTLDGPLGTGLPWSTTIWFRLKVGTLKQSILGLSTRSYLDVALYLLLLASLLQDLLTVAPTMPARTLCLYTALCALDRSAYTGSQGAYYWTLCACCCWPGVAPDERTNALRFVQCMHLLIPGIAKAGPWFVSVTPTMAGMSPLVPARAGAMLFRDLLRGDVRPSWLGRMVGHGGTAAEILIPLGWCVGSPAWVCSACALLGLGMHLYIVTMLPIGSVLEWNAVNGILVYVLFAGEHGGAISFSFVGGGWHPYLLSLWLVLLWFLLVGPLTAHVQPTWFSNHFALRKYTGNHPFHTFLVKKSALQKLNAVPGAKVFVEMAAVSKGAASNDGEDDEDEDAQAWRSAALLSTLVRQRLNAKPLCKIFALAVEGKHSWKDYARIVNSHFFGNAMLDVTFVNRSLLTRLREACGLKKGEMYSIKIDSFPTIQCAGYVAGWSVTDVGADSVKAGGEMEIVWSEAGDVGVTLKDERGGFIGHFSDDDGTKKD